MKKIIYILILLPNLLFSQEKQAIRVFPFYIGFDRPFTEDVSPYFGCTFGYDFQFDEHKYLDVTLKPRIFLLDGDKSAYELRNYINYKRFVKEKFYTSYGLGFHYYNSDSFGPVEYTDGNPDNNKVFSIGPNLIFGRRLVFNKLFLDIGLGLSFNYMIYNKTRMTRVVNESATTPWEYTTSLVSEDKISYFNHLFSLQIGYKF